MMMDDDDDDDDDDVFHGPYPGKSKGKKTKESASHHIFKCN